jgi:hypothetical protein
MNTGSFIDFIKIKCRSHDCNADVRAKVKAQNLATFLHIDKACGIEGLSTQVTA